MTANLEPLKPILTAHLFTKIEAMLLELLRSLRPDDWEKQTLAPKWKVKDVAAHLLDTQLRKLSIARDGYALEGPDFSKPNGFLDFINRLNAEGVGIYRRLSPPVLIDLMGLASQQMIAYHQSLDPFAEAAFSVSWAGESSSKNWFDTARELTERWIHQQQIRIAVERPGIMTRELFHPVLDTFMRALPFTFRTIPAPDGVMAQFNISGESGGSWFLFRDGPDWRLIAKPAGSRICEATLPQEIAWRVFTKGIDRESAKRHLQTSGDREVALHLLQAIAIVG